MDLDEFSDLETYEYERTWELLQFSRLNGSGNMNFTDGNLTVRPVYEEHNIIHNVLIQVIICSLYFIIVICGVFGNGLVVFVVTRNKAMHTVTNIFIASLAVNDTIICALTVPLTPLYTFLEGWYFGSFMCHLFPLIQAASVYISTLTLTAIAVERFCVICFPFLPKLTTKWACSIIVIIWSLSLFICLPYAFFMKYNVPTFEGRGPRCDEEWPSFARRTFGTVSLIVQYSIPLVVISFSYVSVWVKLRSQALKGLSSSQRGREPSAILRKRRTNRMLVAMVIIFGCCWLPLNLVNILNDYFPKTITDWDYFVLVFFLSHVVAVSSTCYNPILYAWMNENFRKEFKAVLPCFAGSVSHRNGSLNRQASTYEKPDHDNGRPRNGVSTSTYMNGICREMESTYLPQTTPKSSRRKLLPSNRPLSKSGSFAGGGGGGDGHEENGRLISTGTLLTVPSYVTLQVQQKQTDGDVYDV
ncbi:putative Neuropeptide Y receptor type 2 [Hypsibius exemplaris]|uniref:Neuropeptide Y receptor type 2 n=1 Tax=Hypsibius exemplaris TaxID=2072580 RepID=A0A1W0XDJ3_HYPEX|nr:putative Neuropeptide Y receptor type 2 [Hypsibius exemplaris]